MSDHPADKSPVESPLPDELQRCESILAGMTLPPARVERDQLMYQAGWAAAEVAGESGAVRPREARQWGRSRGRGLTVAWSLASAAVAASLAVVVTLRVGPLFVADTEQVAPSSGSHTTPHEREQRTTTPDVVPPNPSRPIPRRYRRASLVEWTAPLLVMRDRELFRHGDDRFLGTEAFWGEASTNESPPSGPKTSREMLREMLPGPSA